MMSCHRSGVITMKWRSPLWKDEWPDGTIVEMRIMVRSKLRKRKERDSPWKKHTLENKQKKTICNHNKWLNNKHKKVSRAKKFKKYLRDRKFSGRKFDLERRLPKNQATRWTRNKQDILLTLCNPETKISLPNAANTWLLITWLKILRENFRSMQKTKRKTQSNDFLCGLYAFMFIFETNGNNYFFCHTSYFLWDLDCTFMKDMNWPEYFSAPVNIIRVTFCWCYIICSKGIIMYTLKESI